jgi:hypothetical protein
MRTMKPSTMNPKHPGQSGFANVRVRPAPSKQYPRSRYPLYRYPGLF